MSADRQGRPADRRESDTEPGTRVRSGHTSTGWVGGSPGRPAWSGRYAAQNRSKATSVSQARR